MASHQRHRTPTPSSAALGSRSSEASGSGASRGRRRRRRSHGLKRRIQALAFGFALFGIAGGLLALVLAEMRDPIREDPNVEQNVKPILRSPELQGERMVPVVTCPGADKSVRHPAYAAACGDTRALKDLLAKPLAPDSEDPRPEFAGRTALHHAAQRGDTAMMALLLAAGANPNHADAAGDTPLHLVASTPQLREPEFVAKRLIDGGARLDLTNKRDLTPIQELESHHQHLLHRQNLAKVLFQAEREKQIAQWLGPSVPAGERPLALPEPEPPGESVVEIETSIGRVRLPVDPPAPGETAKGR